jgi:hypothetical protein
VLPGASLGPTAEESYFLLPKLDFRTPSEQTCMARLAMSYQRYHEEATFPSDSEGLLPSGPPKMSNAICSHGRSYYIVLASFPPFELRTFFRRDLFSLLQHAAKWDYRQFSQTIICISLRGAIYSKHVRMLIQIPCCCLFLNHTFYRIILLRCVLWN